MGMNPPSTSPLKATNLAFVMEFPTIFGFTHDDFLRAEISTERTIAENDLAPLYLPRNENFYGKTHGLFLSMQSSTIYSATLSLQSEVTAQASVAQQGISF
jgi:hypothetical protein